MYCRLSYGGYLVTRCPLSFWLDLGTVTLETDGFIEVMAWRDMVASHSFRKIFAEDLATILLKKTWALGRGGEGGATKVAITYRRMFGLITVRVGDTW